MSLFNYFSRLTPTDQSSQQRRQVVLPPPDESSGISHHEFISISDALSMDSEVSRRTTYKEEDKLSIAKYANMFGVASAVRHFQSKHHTIQESTVRGWLVKYRESLNNNGVERRISVSSKRGRPLYLPSELDEKLQTFIMNLRKAGDTVNKHVVSAVLIGLIKSDLTRYGYYLDFTVTNGWLQYLYQRMNLTRRKATTSIWVEVRTKCLHDVVSTCLEFDVPDELIINIDQTPSKYVATDGVTMATKGSKHVSQKGSNDKRAITATFLQREIFKCGI